MVIPMTIIQVSLNDILAGGYAYKSGKKWVKWGWSEDIFKRGREHKISLGELPPYICMILGMTRPQDEYFRQTLEDWRIPFMKDWFYDVEPMWAEARRQSYILEVEFYRTEITPHLPLFDEPPM